MATEPMPLLRAVRAETAELFLVTGAPEPMPVRPVADWPATAAQEETQAWLATAGQQALALTPSIRRVC